LLRRAIDEELRKRELSELGAVLSKFSKSFVVESIREDRDSR